MKLNRKWILVMSLVLSVAMATSGTLAYLTATTKTVTNTFTVGNVAIAIEEPKWDVAADHTLLPGVAVEKDPQIKNTGNTDAWVWMDVSMPNALYGLLDIDWNTKDWSMDKAVVGETDTVVTLKYKTLLSDQDDQDTTSAAFTRVLIDKTVENLSNISNAQISIIAYAIQDANFADVNAAYNAFHGIEAPKGDDDSVKYPVPDDVEEVCSTEELLRALNNGKTNILLKNGEYEWNDNAGHSKTLNLYGESKSVILYITNEAPDGEAADYSFHSSNVTFNGLTISSSTYVPKANGNNYPGFAYMQATYNDCVIDQTYVLYDGPQIFNYCTLNVSGDKYNIWTWGGEDITFNHCTFNSDGKAILLYNGPTTVLKVNDCLFNDNGGLDDLKAAIEIGQDYGNRKYTLNVNNTVVNGYEINDNGSPTGTTLWGNKNSMTQEDLDVVVDGVDVY